MATVTVDSGELPSAKGKKGYELDHVLRHWGMIADGRFEYDCRALLQMIDEVDELRLWEYAKGGFFKTRDEFLEKVVLIDFDLTEQSLNQIVARLRGGDSVRLSRKLREKAGPPPLSERNPYNVRIKYGNSQEYWLARLERDHPAILAAYEQGEYRSVRAAAIAAGIVKVKTPLEQLHSWWTKASIEERQSFLKEITP